MLRIKQWLKCHRTGKQFEYTKGSMHVTRIFDNMIFPLSTLFKTLNPDYHIMLAGPNPDGIHIYILKRNAINKKLIGPVMIEMNDVPAMTEICEVTILGYD